MDEFERLEGEALLRMTFVGEEKTRQEVKSSIVGSEARKNKRHRTGNRADMGRGVLRPYEEEPKTHPHKTRMGHPGCLPQAKLEMTGGGILRG